MIKEALLYERWTPGWLSATSAAIAAGLSPDKFGICGVRQNREGSLVTHVYGEVIAAHIDPIEKKALYHFLPGSSSLSIATSGCNFRCSFCQNWQISQNSKGKQEGLLRSCPCLRRRSWRPPSNRDVRVSLTLTPNRPSFSNMLWTPPGSRQRPDLGNNFVTNGYMTSGGVGNYPSFPRCLQC